MDPDPATGSRLWLWILITAILFIFSALFALMETAFASVSRTRIKVLEERDPRAKKVLYVLDHFDQAVTTLLIVINIAHLSAASIVTLLVSRAYNATSALAGAVTVSTFATTIAMFFLAELLPKSIGK